MKNDEREIEYEIRAVAFIDILGWGSAVEESAKNSAIRKQLYNSVWALGALAENDASDDTPEHPSSDQVSQFSDSVIVSVPFAESHSLTRLIRQVSKYQLSMLMSGFLLRGGISVGEMFHDGPIAFGPALNAAYYLESQEAHSPRVLIDKPLNGDVESAAAEFPKHWPFVTIDSDGYYFPDYLTVLAKSQTASKQIDNMVRYGLSGNPKHLPKYRWLLSKWNNANQDADHKPQATDSKLNR